MSRTMYDEVVAEFQRAISARPKIAPTDAVTYRALAMNVTRMLHDWIGSKEPRDRWLDRGHSEKEPGFIQIEHGISAKTETNMVSFALQITVDRVNDRRLSIPIRAISTGLAEARIWIPETGFNHHIYVALEEDIVGPPTDRWGEGLRELAEHMKRKARDLAQQIIADGGSVAR